MRGVVVGLLMCVLVVRCASSDDLERSTSASSPAASTEKAVISDTVEIADNVVVLSGDAAKNAIVEEESVTVPTDSVPKSLTAIAVGDYVVSGEGDGFLRQVVGVDRSAGLRLRTIEARLADIVINGSVHATLALDPIVLDLSGQAVLGTEDLGVSVTPFILSVTPSVDLTIEIRKNKVVTFATKFRLARSTSLGLSAVAQAPTRFETGDVTLWKSPKWRFVQTIGPVPIVEVLSVTVAAGLRGEISARASTFVSGTCDRTQTYTLGFSDGRWAANQSGDVSCSGAAPTFNSAIGDLSLEAYLKGTLAVDFYGLAGPYVAISDGLLAGVRTCPSPAAVSLDSPARLQIGADLRKLGGPKYETTPVAAAWPIGRWSIDSSSICE